MRAWVAAVALAVLVDAGGLAPWLVPAAIGAGLSFRIGPWEAASSGAVTGLPVTCGATMHQGGNESLGLAVDLMGRAWLVAASPKWTIGPGRPVGTLVGFDERPQESVIARVVDPHQLRFDIPADGPFEASLRAARRIVIYAAGQTVEFRLEQTGEVLDRLRQCTTQGATAAARGPDAPPPRLARDSGAARALERLAAPLPMPRSAWPSLQLQTAPMPAVLAAGPRPALPALYSTLRPSVLLVVAERGHGSAWTTIGSAVAVSGDTLLTNCHVLRDARRIELRRARNTALAATILTADPQTDRCFLRTTAAGLTPVPGLRPMASVAVGERVYTIGNPSNLESTFGEGIVSGLREAGGVRLIQTTAPVSPGSSGGGLFDAHGNLLGITTFIVRAPGDTDIFRFAIAAEEFWR